MDAVGARRSSPSLPSCARRWTARRATRAARCSRWLERLLGLELKLRQYELGQRFCDAVVAEAGVEALHRVSARPELLPALAELRAIARRAGRARGHAPLAPDRGL